MLSSKNKRRHSKKCSKNKRVCLNKVIWLITKMRLKIQNVSHRYRINRPRLRHRHNNYTKFKICVIGIKQHQHLKLISWKSETTHAELKKKSVALEKKRVITHFVWYLEKEKKHDIETLSMDLIKNLFMENWCRKYAPKASLRLFLILVNNPKQSLHYCFQDISKEDYQKVLRNLTLFFSFGSSPF